MGFHAYQETAGAVDRSETGRAAATGSVARIWIARLYFVLPRGFRGGTFPAELQNETGQPAGLLRGAYWTNTLQCSSGSYFCGASPPALSKNAGFDGNNVGRRAARHGG